MTGSGKRLLTILAISLLMASLALTQELPAAGSTRSADGRPVASLPSDFTSEFPVAVTIAGSYVNESSNVTGLVWNQTGGPAVNNLTQYENKLNFTPSKLGTYTFELRVTDDKGNTSDPAHINITVTPNNPPTVLPYASTLEIEEDGDIEIDISKWVDDPDEELTFGLKEKDSMITVNPLGFGSFQIQADNDFSGLQGVTFYVRDEFNNSVDLAASVVISSVPDTPQFAELNGEQILVGTQGLTGYEDTKVWLNFTIYDPDLTYGSDTLTLTSDQPRITIEGTNGWFVPTQDDIGTMIINFKVKDSYSLEANISVVLDILEVNDPPTLVVRHMIDNVNVSTNLGVDFVGTDDPDEDQLTFYVKEDLGDWIEIQGFHVLNFQTPGNHTIWFKVEDGHGGVDSKQFHITVMDPNPVDDDAVDDDVADDDDVVDDDDDSKDSLIDLPLIIGGAVILLFILAIAVFVFIRIGKKDKKDEKVKSKGPGVEMDDADEELEVTASLKKKTVMVEEEVTETPLSPQPVPEPSAPLFTPPDFGIPRSAPYYPETPIYEPPMYPKSSFIEEQEEEEEVEGYFDESRIHFDEDEEEDQDDEENGDAWGDEEDDDEESPWGDDEEEEEEDEEAWEDEEEDDPWSDDDDDDEEEEEEDDPW